MTMNLTFRETTAGDIEDMFSLRARTRQNPISKVDLAAFGITPASTAADMASGKMKGWGCFHDSAMVGFCNALAFIVRQNGQNKDFARGAEL